MPNDWLTTIEAGQRLGITPARIRQLCQAGRIVGAQKVGRDWVIPDPPQVEPGSHGSTPRPAR